MASAGRMVKIVFYNVIGYFPLSIRQAPESEQDSNEVGKPNAEEIVRVGVMVTSYFQRLEMTFCDFLDSRTKMAQMKTMPTLTREGRSRKCLSCLPFRCICVRAGQCQGVRQRVSE